MGEHWIFGANESIHLYLETIQRPEISWDDSGTARDSLFPLDRLASKEPRAEHTDTSKSMEAATGFSPHLSSHQQISSSRTKQIPLI